MIWTTGQHIAEPRRQILFLFEVAAERQHGHIDGESKRCAETLDVLIVPARRAFLRHAFKARKGERHDE